MLLPYMFTTTAHLAPISAAGTFAQGVLTWTSGKNAGLSCFVRGWAADYDGSPTTDQIQLDVQTLFPMAAGDAFTIQQGCNKTFASCADLQGDTNTYVNFGGQPNTPVPETAIG